MTSATETPHRPVSEKPALRVQRRNGRGAAPSAVPVPDAEGATANERIGEILIGTRARQASMIEKVRQGLPVSSIERVRGRMQILDTGRLLRLLGMSQRTYLRYKKEKRTLDAVQSDRLYRLAKIEARTVEVFGEAEMANDWLKSLNRALGAAPLDLLDTEAGTEQVERILTRIEHGVYS